MVNLKYQETPPQVHGHEKAEIAVPTSQRWTSSKSPQTASFLHLPREIRDAIIGELFFPGEKEPVEFDQNTLGLATTAIRQIFPYDQERKPIFDTAIFRTCQQLQEEGEAVLYGSSSWNLMYQDWDDDVKLSYEFLEKLPKRCRRLIRRIERKCYSKPYSMKITLYDWKLFMTFLAQECPNLHSLKLWAPGDRNEGPPWVKTCRRDAEWVQAILHIKTLLEFDIPVIRGGVIYNHPEFKDGFLPWLKSALLHQPGVPSDSAPSQVVHQTPPFRLLDLPRAIRDRIYRFALLPPTRQIHPYIKSWYDQTTQNVLPLFLACKQIHRESESILFGQGIFTTPLRKYQVKLLKMFREHTGILPLQDPFPVREASGIHFSGRQVRLVKHVRVYIGSSKDSALLSFVARAMELESIELVLEDPIVKEMNRQWFAPDGREKWRGGFSDMFLRDIARIPTINAETSDTVVLDPACLEWFAQGLRREALSGSGDNAEMR
ncbi:hypothetical protein MMC30_000964 [Trapelia coarctata]|nr:hypothetical protein [Trapelia coarctata]